MEIKVKYFNESIPELCFIGGSISNWVDLCAARTINIKQGEFMAIPLGIAVELPKGYEALIAPRSSTFKNYGIIQVNSPGVIDNSFCGDDDQWHMLVYATRYAKIEAGDRICQFRVIESQPNMSFITVASLDNKSRGGLGSTGR